MEKKSDRILKCRLLYKLLEAERRADLGNGEPPALLRSFADNSLPPFHPASDPGRGNGHVTVASCEGDDLSHAQLRRLLQRPLEPVGFGESQNQDQVQRRLSSALDSFQGDYEDLRAPDFHDTTVSVPLPVEYLDRIACSHFQDIAHVVRLIGSKSGCSALNVFGWDEKSPSGHGGSYPKMSFTFSNRLRSWEISSSLLSFASAS